MILTACHNVFVFFDFMALLLVFYHPHTGPPLPVPQFIISPRNVTVNESVGEVEICVTSAFPVSEQTIVLGETQTKDGDFNQATGR